jgi:hypothetical protein
MIQRDLFSHRCVLCVEITEVVQGNLAVLGWQHVLFSVHMGNYVSQQQTRSVEQQIQFIAVWIATALQ